MNSLTATIFAYTMIALTGILCIPFAIMTFIVFAEPIIEAMPVAIAGWCFVGGLFYVCSLIIKLNKPYLEQK